MQIRTMRFQRLLGLLLCISLLNLKLEPVAALADATNDNTATIKNAAAPEEMEQTSKHSLQKISAAPVQGNTDVAATPTPTPASANSAPPLALAAFAPFPAAAQPAPFQLLGQTATNLIQITDAGFNPATLNVFGPTDVTWVNNTNSTQTLRSGTPGQNPEVTNSVFLPLIQRGSRSAVQAASEYLTYLRSAAAAVPDFSATLAPGQTFSYRFTTPGQTKFYLTNAPQFTGQLALSGTALLRTSPANGEAEVSATRETILEFSGPLDAASVTAAFTARFGNENLAYRLNLSPDKTRVTLFYTEPLPGSARIRVTVDGNTLKDAQGGGVDVDGDGAAGGSALLEFDTLSLTVVPGTVVCGRVFASELAVNASNVSVNTPLTGVTVSVAGLEGALNTKTDVNGNFCLNPAPSGHFFVYIDGHTATNNVPAGAYYPFVGKLWESTPGQRTNIGDAFLPLVVAGTLQDVSETADTQITFPDAVMQGHPELAGVSVLVPANSLFNDDGERGGKVGIAPVPPDRLPGGLPPGLNFPVVITVQTDGASNFDTPAPVCFPNLPDPNTGKKLDPGAKDALYSFNHDKGSWETVGSMTVTADGRLVCSDPGVGIRAPGWHGNGPRPWEPPPPPPPPPCGSTNEITSSTTPPQQCPPPCNPDEAEKCFKRADEDFQTCQQLATINTGKCHLDNATWLHPIDLVKCSVYDRIDRKICTNKRNVDHNRCIEDNPGCFPAQVSQINASNSYEDVFNSEDPIIEEASRKLEKISDLIYDYLLNGIGTIGEIQQQAKSLLDEANALANGNFVQYIKNTLQQEQQATLYDSTGNAPAYPILYVAQIHLVDKELYLRSKTQPLGQYTLFVPRGGELQSVSFYDPKTRQYGRIYPKLAQAVTYRLPRLTLMAQDNSFIDTDKDGLADPIEVVYGTDPANPDTDGDGINDGAEVAQGTDPLGGFIAQTGIIGSADTPGTAVDICVQNDLAVVADSNAGVAVFNVFDNQNPKLIAQVDTPGNAQRVACANGRVAVADGDSGLALVDISNAATARITQQINLNGKVTAVATAGTVAYAATATGRIVAVDMTNGTILGEVTVAEDVQDLSVQGETLYALTTKKLYAIDSHNNALAVTGSADSPGQIGAGGRSWRLFVGGNLAYATHTQGYNTFDLTSPGQPVLIKAGTTEQYGWKQIIPNGAGVGVAAVGPNSTDDDQHNISLYDVRDPQQIDAFITQFDTPGLAAAVTLYKGRAYVADSEAGMQVINYLAYDSKKVPPTLALTTNFAPGKAEEGALLRITTNTTDDVQVRHVEYYVDGKLVATDGSFPFEYRFITPRIAAQPSFNLRVRAVDTGGNETWTDEQTITLVKDATPPIVISATPISATNPVGSVSKVMITFNEAINVSTLTPQNFALFSMGADKFLGTSDDVFISGGSITYDVDTRTASLTFAAPLPPGIYRITVATAVTDLAGNSLAKSFNHDFDVTELIFADNFDSEGPPAYNYDTFHHWNVTRGSVDLVGAGLDDVYPENGFYIDLDGSTRAAGRLESNIDFSLRPGDYRLSFTYGNNPYNSNTNTVLVALGNAFSTTLSLTGESVLQSFNQVLTINESITGRLVFDHSGGDNVGIILDNVKLERVSTQTGNVTTLSQILIVDSMSNTRRNGD